MYCFQDGSEVISIKREATDTQQEQQNSAVAITFPTIKAEEEVSCISLYPLLFIFSNTLGCQNTCFVLYTWLYTIHTFKHVSDKCQSHRNLPCSALHCHSAVSIPHVWFALPTELFPFCILCLYSLCFPRCVKFIPYNLIQSVCAVTESCGNR